MVSKRKLKFKKNSTYHSEEEFRLTCFAIPKSASFTRPLGSTSMLAPLMSLHDNKLNAAKS